MASSSTYKDKRDAKKKEVKKYEGQIKELNKIIEDLTDDGIFSIGNKIKDANGKINDLHTDLEASITGNKSFSTFADNIFDSTEARPGNDGLLSAAIGSIEAEVASLSQKMATAAAARDEYDRLYERAKADEEEAKRQRMAEALKNLFKF